MAATAPAIPAKSAPMVAAKKTEGMQKPNPPIRHAGIIPRKVLNPSKAMSMMNGIRTTMMPNCSVVYVAIYSGAKLVSFASVVSGRPTEPNELIAALETRQAITALTGGTPIVTNMLAPIATAVPKPDIHSRKAPKPHAMMRMSIRLSVLTELNMDLIFSMPPVCTVKLYANIAETMTPRIGHIAMRAPSSVPVMTSVSGMSKHCHAMRKEIISAMGHAFHAGNFKTLSAMMSHRIGANP